MRKRQDFPDLFLQIFDQQLKMAANPIYGWLNIYAWYDPESKRVHVDVISAENLVPRDVDRHSDPFVAIR